MLRTGSLGNGGEGGIRTHGRFHADSFQDCSIKPDSGTSPRGHGGGAGIRTLGAGFCPAQRFSKPPLSATQPPHLVLVFIRYTTSIQDLATSVNG